MPLLYDLGTAVYHAGVRLAGLWNPKAKAWIEGRNRLWSRLEQAAPRLQGCIWMHCASVGEFEQGRPVLEAIKAKRPDLPVLLTFFSPSGYEARKNEPLATHVDYLPADGRRNAQRLQELVRPAAAIFVKYEFWYHHLSALREQRVPTFLIAALFRRDQPFFRWYGGAWRYMLRCFTHIFTQDQTSLDLLAEARFPVGSMEGDPRFDRVATIAARHEELDLPAAFAGDGPVLVCGSTWPKDDELVAAALDDMRQAAPKCIVVPHELHPAQLASIEQAYPKPLARYSELQLSPLANVSEMLGRMRSGTLLVDRMGLLARTYRYGQVAYIGGGFTDGIHSVLEAAAWGVPVIFGPKHRKFPEAQGLIDAGAARSVTNASELKSALAHWFSDPMARNAASRAAARYVAERTGGAQRVAKAVLHLL